VATTAPASIQELDFKPRGKVFPSPRDWRDAFIYQLLVDRFDDGKDYPPYDADNAKRGRDRDKAGTFQGGTLKGITRRLDYIKGLGCNAVWISPPFKQRQDDAGSYHGYAIQDFLDIDPRFGTAADLQELTREAHKRDMYVILDIVINHTADVFRYETNDAPYKADGQYAFKEWHKVSKSKQLTWDDAVWPVELQTPEAFKRKGAIRDLTGASDDEAVNGDFFSLKELDMGNQAVMDALIAAYKWWIAVSDVDGYRIDTVRNVEPRFLAAFTNAIHEYCKRIGKDNFLVFGEIVASDDLLHKYIGTNGPAHGTDEWFPRLDAALDFPLYGVLDEVIKGAKPCADLRARYEHLARYYRDLGEAAKYYVTFLDNHDQSHRPWRRFMNNQDHDHRLVVLGIGYLLCNLGIPCIYYGTEQGFDGGGDSDVFVRETMFGGAWGAFDTTGVHFFDADHPAYQSIARVAKVRAEQPALRYGRQYFRDTSADGQTFSCPTHGKCVLAFSRVFDTQEVLVAMNLDVSPREDWILVDGRLTPAGTKLRDVLDDSRAFLVEETPQAAAVRVKLDGRQMAILTR
jgi:glycosidase